MLGFVFDAMLVCFWRELMLLFFLPSVCEQKLSRAEVCVAVI